MAPSSFLLVLCGAVFVWKLYDAFRDRSNTAAWSTVAATGCISAVILLAKPVVARPLDALVGDDFAALLRNLAFVACFAALQLFYLTNIATFRAQLRRRIELSALAVAAVVMVVSTLAVNPDVSLALDSTHLDSSAVVVFFLAVSGYISYSCLTQMWWTLRDLLRIRQILLRVSTLASGLGAACILVPQGRRVFYYLILLLTGENLIPPGAWMPALFFLRVGVPLLVVGLFLPIVVASWRSVVAVCVSAVRYWRLEPLDTVVRVEFPEVIRPVKPHASDPSATEALPRPTRAVFFNKERLQRCRDGYGRLTGLMQGEGDELQHERGRELLDALRAMPGGAPADHEASSERSLIGVARWLKQYQDGELLAQYRAADAPSHVA